MQPCWLCYAAETHSKRISTSSDLYVAIISPFDFDFDFDFSFRIFCRILWSRHEFFVFFFMNQLGYFMNKPVLL